MLSVEIILNIRWMYGDLYYISLFWNFVFTRPHLECLLPERWKVVMTPGNHIWKRTKSPQKINLPRKWGPWEFSPTSLPIFHKRSECTVAYRTTSLMVGAMPNFFQGHFHACKERGEFRNELCLIACIHLLAIPGGQWCFVRKLEWKVKIENHCTTMQSCPCRIKSSCLLVSATTHQTYTLPSTNRERCQIKHHL